jgi:histidyl-tRNA synthetase
VIQAPRGTFDVLPEDHARRDVVEGHAKRVLGAAGYERIETPAFEATELFARGVGEATDIVQKEMYTFDDGGGRSVTLRPEGTAPVCRAYVEHGMHKLPQPIKHWYLSSFFRSEAPQRGRFRQFWQVGAEAIGAAGPDTDAELIVLLAELFEGLEVKDLTLKLSSLGTPETRARYREELTSYLKAHESALSEDVRARIELNPMRAFDAIDAGTRETMKDAPKLLDRLTPEDTEHFEQVKALLDDTGIAYELDPTLVRGLDYYTRTVFEFSSDALGAQSGVGGGGRYDRLIEQLDGPPTPACGWAAGVERMLLAAAELPSPAETVDLFVARAEGARAEGRGSDERGRDNAFKLAVNARRAGLNAQLELSGRSLKGQLKHADRIRARYVAIVQEDGVALKNMESGEQQQLEPTAVIATVLRGSRLS